MGNRIAQSTPLARQAAPSTTAAGAPSVGLAIAAASTNATLDLLVDLGRRLADAIVRRDAEYAAGSVIWGNLSERARSLATTVDGEIELETSGWNAHDARLRAIWAECDALEAEITSRDSTTNAGEIVKLRLAVRIIHENHEDDDTPLDFVEKTTIAALAGFERIASAAQLAG